MKQILWLLVFIPKGWIFLDTSPFSVNIIRTLYAFGFHDKLERKSVSATHFYVRPISYLLFEVQSLFLQAISEKSLEVFNPKILPSLLNLIEWNQFYKVQRKLMAFLGTYRDN